MADVIQRKPANDDSKAKVSKFEAHYGPGTLQEHCGICTMFIKPHGCTAVRGHIRAQDWCKYFERK